MSPPHEKLPDDWETLLWLGCFDVHGIDTRLPNFRLIVQFTCAQLFASLGRLEAILRSQDEKRKRGDLAGVDVRLVVRLAWSDWPKTKAALQDFLGFGQQLPLKPCLPTPAHFLKKWIHKSPASAEVLKRLLKLHCALMLACEMRNYSSTASALKDFAGDLKALASAAKRVHDKWFVGDLKHTPGGQEIPLASASCADLYAAVLDDPAFLKKFHARPEIPKDVEGPILTRVQLLRGGFGKRLARVSEDCDSEINHIKKCFPDFGIAATHRPSKHERDKIILLLKEAGATVREIMDFGKEVLGRGLTEKAVREAIARARKWWLVD